MNQKELGALGELLTAALFRGLGFFILASNVRVGRDEIDLIAVSKTTVVFVEVKTRTAGIASGAEAVTPAKLARMQRAAMRWLDRQDTFYEHLRFDVVEVTVRGSSYSIEHLPEVI